MFPPKLSRIVLLLASLTVSGCATKSAGVLRGNGPAHVAAVEVIGAGSAITPEFSSQLHAAVIKAAALYGNAGQPVTIQIGLDKVHYKNPLKALVGGDDNLAKGGVSVLDKASGQQLGTFAVRVNAERPSSAASVGTGIALFLVEAADPTGAVGVAHVVADASSATLNRKGTSAGLCANFAAETLRQTFGDERTKAAEQSQRR
jgi:hypothetical protein